MEVVLIILFITLLILILKHKELFIVNPKFFFGKKNPSNDDIKDMRKFRECHGVTNKEYCMLGKRTFIKKPEIRRVGFKKYVNYQVTQRASDLLPQKKPNRPFPNIY